MIIGVVVQATSFTIHNHVRVCAVRTQRTYLLCADSVLVKLRKPHARNTNSLVMNAAFASIQYSVIRPHRCFSTASSTVIDSRHHTALPALLPSVRPSSFRFSSKCRHSVRSSSIAIRMECSIPDRRSPDTWNYTWTIPRKLKVRIIRGDELHTLFQGRSANSASAHSLQISN